MSDECWGQERTLHEKLLTFSSFQITFWNSYLTLIIKSKMGISYKLVPKASII